MADGVYISMTGAAARALELDSVADNLANAQTPGFKAARPAFEAFLPAGGAEDKVYPAVVGTGVDLRPGQPTHTGNPMDVLPEGDGMLAVRLATGETALTRAGRIAVDANGRLTTAGLPLLSTAGQPIDVPPGATATIGPDGMVTADGQEIGRIGVWKPTGPVSRLGTQLLSTGDKPPAPVEQGRLRVGELELGNYTALEATVQLINAQRSFDSSMQAMATYKQLDTRATEIGRVR